MRTRLFLAGAASLSFFLLLLAGCELEVGPDSEVQFETMGLDGHKVVQFAAYDEDERLYAATDRGIYAQAQNTWQRISPNTWRVHTIAVLYPSHLLAGVTIGGEHRLMESLNSGTDWRPVSTDFGGDAGTALGEPLLNLMFEEGTGMLYGVGLGAFAESDDFGRSWTLLDGDWQTLASGLAALARDPRTGDFWIGGQGSIENPVLHQVSPFGEVVDHSGDAAELLDVPSVIKSVRFPGSGSRILASGEGGIIVSADDGGTWAPLLTNETSRFYFDVLPDPANASRLYTAGWDKNFDDPQPLKLEVSSDGGATWQSHRYRNASLRGGVWSMTLRREQGDKWLYFGLCNGGIVRAKIRF